MAVEVSVGCRQTAECGAGEVCVEGTCQDASGEEPGDDTPDIGGDNSGRVDGEGDANSSASNNSSANNSSANNSGVPCEGGGTQRRFYLDVDGDGYGVDEDVLEACAPDGAYRAVRGGDCDDSAAEVSPVEVEVCDGVDNTCDGEVDEGLLNACGGCAALEARPGEACGCGGGGVWACAGEDALRCEGGVGNGCGGCGALEETPGEACGACGVVTCSGTDTTVCAERGENACGGCSALPGEPGAACGACGAVVCDGEEGTRCDDPGRSACGGCGALPGEPGEACGTCGVWACAGEGVVCQEGVTNACGGCGALEHVLGTSCGACGLDVYGCGEDGQTRCLEVVGCPEGWTRVEAGSFVMGSPSGEPGRGFGNQERQHPVTLTRPLMVMVSEVPQWAWEAVMGGNPADHRCALCPVESVTWWDALRFANALSAVYGLAPCYSIEDTGDFVAGRVATWSGPSCDGFRLPSEAEWEYVARAGTTTAFYSGALQLENELGCDRDRSGNLARIGWYCRNTDETREVASREANAWGLFDVSGNVGEWVWDARSDYSAEGQTDPTGGLRLECSDVPFACPRVVRGGHWDADPQACRSAARAERPAWSASDEVGLRLVRSIPAPGTPR